MAVMRHGALLSLLLLFKMGFKKFRLIPLRLMDVLMHAVTSWELGNGGYSDSCI